MRLFRRAGLKSSNEETGWVYEGIVFLEQRQYLKTSGPSKQVVIFGELMQQLHPVILALQTEKLQLVLPGRPAQGAYF